MKAVDIYDIGVSVIFECIYRNPCIEYFFTYTHTCEKIFSTNGRILLLLSLQST